MTTLTQTTEIVNFRNQPLVTLKVGEIIYTALRPIVEGMGLDWASQYTKLKKNAQKFNCCDIATVAEDGKIREMLCIPIKKLNGWLFSINPEKVKPEIKQDVIDYQEECFEVLYNYWHKGEAVNPRRITLSPKQKGTIRQLIAKKCKDDNGKYQTLYSALNAHCGGVNSYHEILASDFIKAIEFITTYSFPVANNHAEYNALWRTIGLMEYHRVDDEMRKLQNALSQLTRQFNVLCKTKGLIYDALMEQKITSLTNSAEINAKAQDFIDRQLVMKIS